MGRDSRKNKSSSGQSRGKPSPSPTVSKLSDHDLNLNQLDFTQEVDKSGFLITWKECLWIVAGLLAFAAFSIFVGVAAGISISIHYFETTTDVPSFPRLNARERELGPHQRTTILDPSIADSNSLLQRDRAGLDLTRVITASPTGQLNVLSVVEESRLLYDDVGNESSGKYHTGDTKVASESPRIHSKIEPPKIEWATEAKVKPKLCSDGQTMGFDKWQTLKEAIQEVNAFSAIRFMKWNEYFAISESFRGVFEDDSLYYQEDIIITICPGVTLKAKKGPIFINAENIIMECEGCMVAVGGSHFAFGPHAKNIQVRGITFTRARTSSLNFFYDGADVAFEDCRWYDNTAVSQKHGAVADVNSTSVVNFLRCQMSQKPVSSLSIRTKE